MTNARQRMAVMIMAVTYGRASDPVWLPSACWAGSILVSSVTLTLFTLGGGGKALKDGSDDYGGHIPCLISICMFVHINRWRVWPCRLCNKSVIELQFICNTFGKCPMCFTSASLTWPVIWRPICAKFWVAASVWVVHITPEQHRICTSGAHIGAWHFCWKIWLQIICTSGTTYHSFPNSHRPTPTTHVLCLHWPSHLSTAAIPTSMIGFLCL